MKLAAGNRAKAVLVAAYGVVVAVAATLYGGLHGHDHEGSTLHAHGHEGASTGGHAHPDAALLVAAAGLGLVALVWLLLPADRRRSLPGQLALCSAGAATIHFAVIQPHWDEYVPFALAFALTGVFQLAWAAVVLVRPTRLVLLAGAVVNLGVAAVWVLSRTAGMPVGPEPWTPEAVGVADVVSTIFEVVIAGGSLVLLSSQAKARYTSWLDRRAVAQLVAIAIGVTLLVALTLL
jgi:hypothetical protein